MAERIWRGVRGAMNHRGARLVIFLAAVGALALVPLRAPARSPNILIVVVDTLRADRLGTYGNSRGLTPFLDELASRGTRFANAYAPSSWTCPSVASLLTSRYASQHHVTSFEAKLGDAEVTLAEILQEHGYAAGGFSANFRLADTHGYAQGFDHWRSYVNQDTNESKVRGDRLLRDSGEWIARTGSRTGAPMLVYLQYMEPHTPYVPPEPFFSRFVRQPAGADATVARSKLIAAAPGDKALTAPEIDLLTSLYDGEVAAADAQLRRLFEELERSGFLDDAVIVVTADHGEEFGEHQQFLHGFTLYNTAIRVPLIIVAPGIAGSRVVQDNVSLLDVAPTVLALVKAPAAPTFEGRSLVPLMTGDPAPPLHPPVLSELEPMHPKVDWREHSRALISGTRKLVVKRNGRMAAFALSRDPGESRAWLVRPNDRFSGDLVQALQSLSEDLQKSAATEAQRQPIDESTKEKLRALGYQP
jgi:arylsulfatase A-like enzyme